MDAAFGDAGGSAGKGDQCGIALRGIYGRKRIEFRASGFEFAVAVIAVGSTIGGQLGGMYGRRLPPAVLRGVIVVVGTTAAVRLLVT